MVTKLFHVALLIVLCIGNSFSNNIPQNSEAEHLTLEISTIKTEFAPLEPIPIGITLSNTSQQPILGYTKIDFRGPIELVTIHKEGIQPVGNLSPMTRTTDLALRMIEPGERLHSTQLLMLELDKIFPAPGTYKLQALFPHAKGEGVLKSNLVDVYIRQPNSLEMQAIEFIKNRDLSADCISGLGFRNPEEGKKVLEEFISKYNKTVYGDYAAFSLAKKYFYSDDGTGRVFHEKDYRRSIALLKPLAIKENFAFADQVLFYIISANFKLGEFEEVKHYLSILRTLYPNSKYIYEAERSIPVTVE